MNARLTRINAKFNILQMVVEMACCKKIMLQTELTIGTVPLAGLMDGAPPMLSAITTQPPPYIESFAPPQTYHE